MVWEVTLDSALPADMSALSGVAVIPEGETAGSLDLSVLNDDVPELEETFSVAITSVSKGARIGTPQSTTITIAPSDDPHGVFG